METAQDIAGFQIFSSGDAGHAHVVAHRLVDLGQWEEGYRWLGQWLATHPEGSGSAWVHLQWHMMVFELAVGKWHDAHHRFQTQILSRVEEAPTDAPAALWRLALAAPHPVMLPWDEVRDDAAARLDDPSNPYVMLHRLLALAGSGDLATLDRWLRTQAGQAHPVLHAMGRALRSYVGADYGDAVRDLSWALPQIGSLGGSHAQNQLFFDIHRSACQLGGVEGWDLMEQAA